LTNLSFCIEGNTVYGGNRGDIRFIYLRGR
jgi:hypothetical protein